jgi:hypothetical protein
MIRPSMKPWRSRAASYSAFSDRSPFFARLLDRLDDRRPVDGLEPLQFGLQALGAGGGDGNRHRRCHPKKNAPTQPGQLRQL